MNKAICSFSWRTRSITPEVVRRLLLKKDDVNWFGTATFVDRQRPVVAPHSSFIPKNSVDVSIQMDRQSLLNPNATVDEIVRSCQNLRKKVHWRLFSEFQRSDWSTIIVSRCNQHDQVGLNEVLKLFCSNPTLHNGACCDVFAHLLSLSPQFDNSLHMLMRFVVEKKSSASQACSIFRKMIRDYSYEHSPEPAYKLLTLLANANVVPDSYLYAHVMSSFSRCQDHEKVFQVFDDIKSRGFSLNEQICRTVLHACRNHCTSPKKYLIEFERMEKSWLKLIKDLPNIFYLIIVSSLHANDIDCAMYYFNLQKKMNVFLGDRKQEEIYVLFMNSFCCNSKKDGLRNAIALYKDMVSKISVIGPGFGSAIKCAAFFEDIDFCNQILSDARDSKDWDLDIDAYNGALRCAHFDSNPRLAFNIFDEIQSRYPEVVPNEDTLLLVVEILRHKSDLEANTCFQIVESFSHMGVSPTISVYTSVVRVCTLTGSLSDVIAVYASINKSGLAMDIKAFTILAHAFLHFSDEENLIRVFQDMKKVGVEPDIAFFDTIFTYISKHSDFNDCYEFLHSIKSRVGSLSKYHSLHLALFKVAFQNNRFSEGIRIAYNMECEGFRLRSQDITVAINGCKSCHHIIELLNLCERLQDSNADCGFSEDVYFRMMDLVIQFEVFQYSSLLVSIAAKDGVNLHSKFAAECNLQASMKPSNEPKVSTRVNTRIVWNGIGCS